MREVEIDGKAVKIRANPLALLYYKQEFKSDLVGDMFKWQNVGNDPTRLDFILFLQLVWAMAKAGSNSSKDFPSFKGWLAGLESFDITDEELITEVITEAQDGFFRGSAGDRRR